MKIVDLYDIPDFHNKTKTMQHMGTLLGNKVNILQEVIKLRKDLTFQVLTDGLKNVYSKDKTSKFENSDALVFEWKIDVTKIPRIRVVENCTSDGKGKTPFSIILEKNFYSAGDTFALENQQQLFVKQDPEQLGPNRWRYIVTMEGNDLTRGVDTRFMSAGRTTQYRSNYFPEGCERGFSKFMYNVEIHRGYISRHRVADSWTGDMASIYFEVNTKDKGKQYFYMYKPEQRLMELFLLTRENNLIFGRSNHDVTGKCLEFDDQGRPIPKGDGLIAQIERYCDKFNYAKLTTSLFNDAINSMVRRSGKWMDNNITVVCNHIGYVQAMEAMEDKLRLLAIDGAYYYTRDKVKADVSVGANYKQYNYNGNTITFTIDTALTEAYDKFGYILFVDTSIIEGRPNITMFTLKGRELLQGTLRGMGGVDGRSSGDVATAIDGTEMHLLGYSGLAYFNPYSGFILQENIA